jgi:hypothetical protein
MNGFSSVSAKDTMLFAARTLDRMANDLESRLEHRYRLVLKQRPDASVDIRKRWPTRERHGLAGFSIWVKIIASMANL